MRTRSPLLFLIAAGSLLLPIAVLAGPQPEGPWEPDTDEVELAHSARSRLNEERAELDLGRLLGDADLDRLAYQHSREMATRGRVTHHSYLFGVGTETRVKLAFPRVLQFAENVARNRTVEALHSALLASPGHRLNRLDPSFTHVGVGVARAGPDVLYITEVFVRVADRSQLSLDRLYTAVDPDTLPRDRPLTGEVVSESITVGAPGEDDPEHWTRRGIIAFDESRYDTAVELFERALELQPDYAFARFNLARALLRAGRAPRALAVLDRHLDVQPDDLDAWSTRGTAALLVGEYALAERSFRRLLEDRQRDAGSWYNLGLALEYQGRLEQAESAYAQALHLDPEMQAARAGLRRLRR